MTQERTARCRLEGGAGRLELTAEAVWIGPDLLVSIWGGQRPHIGAVAAAAPRPSLADPARTSATASVLTYLGHKEDGVAKAAAERLAAGLETRVVVTAGMHWDGLAPEEIARVEELAADLVARLLARLQGKKEEA